MSKRGQGLTISTIVIAALVIIVLVVLILIFTGNMGPFSATARACGERGGVCKASCDPAKEIGLSAAEAKCDGTNICCFTAPTTT